MAQAGSEPPPLAFTRKRKRPEQGRESLGGHEESHSTVCSPSGSRGLSIPSFVDVDGYTQGAQPPHLSALPFFSCSAGVAAARVSSSGAQQGGDQETGRARDDAGGPAEGGLQHLGAGGGEPRRMKQPTLAIYGMVCDTAALKKELTDRDARIEELAGRLSEAAEELARRDAHIRFLEGRAEQGEGRLTRFRQVLREEMLRSAVQGRVEARRALHQKHFELGHVATWPGSEQAMWIEGNVICDLIRKRADVAKRREEVEALKKIAQNNLKRQERDREETSASAENLYASIEAQEELQLRSTEHAALLSTLSSIDQRLSDLDKEKKLFMKEIRRINEEDASEYLGQPTLGEGGRYVLMSLLGKGGFSEVWRAFDLLEGRYVACKIHHIKREWSAQSRESYCRRAERELKIMHQLDHPHLTKLYDVFSVNEMVVVSVMEYSRGVDLDLYLKRNHVLKEPDARLILLQIVSALRYLAGLKHPIIHYDLKPANILLHSEDTCNLEIKITDFGLSKIIIAATGGGDGGGGPSDNPSIELTSQGTGTYWYLPPECFDTSATPRINSKVDVWSVGVIYFQMLFGRRPFAEGESQRKIWQEKLIVSSARTLTFPDSPRVSDEAKDLIARCLAFNVNERYDITELSHHPYLFRTARRHRHRSVAADTPKSTGPVS